MIRASSSALLFACVAALAWPAPSAATLSPITARSKAIGEHVWNEPCWRWGGVHIRRDYIDDGVDAHSRVVLGEATVDRDSNGDVVACRVTINKRFVFSPGALCTIVVHELGHLAGYRAPEGEQFVWYANGARIDDYDHSRSRDSVMYPYMSGRDRPYSRCAQAFGDRYSWRMVGED